MRAFRVKIYAAARACFSVHSGIHCTSCGVGQIFIPHATGISPSMQSCKNKYTTCDHTLLASFPGLPRLQFLFALLLPLLLWTEPNFLLAVFFTAGSKVGEYDCHKTVRILLCPCECLLPVGVVCAPPVPV